LVQLNVLLLVAQSKFKPSKREICLLSNKFSYLLGRCRRLRSVTLSAAAIKLPKRKKTLNNFIADLRNIIQFVR